MCCLEMSFLSHLENFNLNIQNQKIKRLNMEEIKEKKRDRQRETVLTTLHFTLFFSVTTPSSERALSGFSLSLSLSPSRFLQCVSSSPLPWRVSPYSSRFFSSPFLFRRFKISPPTNPPSSRFVPPSVAAHSSGTPNTPHHATGPASSATAAV